MFFKIEKQFIIFCILSLVPVLLGATVVFGWHTNNSSLIQVLPNFAPMQYNTALSFVFSGLGIFFLTTKHPTITSIFGFTVSILGSFTLAQYIFHLNFGIDQLFIEHNIVTKTSHPGRMAPNTALCFLLCGLSLSLQKLRKQMLMGMGAAVLILSFLSLTGYLIGEESIYGWGTLTRMAIHTALGFFLIGIALFYFGLLCQKEENIDLWQFSPFTLAAITIVLTIFSWYAVRENALKRNNEYFNQLISDTKHGLKETYRLYEHSLSGGVGMFYASNEVERKEWRSYVNTLMITSTLPGINGLGYIDYVEEEKLSQYLEEVRKDGALNFINHPDTMYGDKFIIQYIEPENINEEAIGLDIGFEKNRRSAAEHARDYGTPTLTRKIELVQDSKKEPGFLLLVPVYSTKKTPHSVGERRSHFQGWVYAPFIGSNFLKDLKNITRGQLDFEVYDGIKSIPENLIYSTDDILSDGHASTSYKKQTTISLGEKIWTINWHASQSINLPTQDHVAQIILILGMMLSALLYLALTVLLRGKEITAKEIDKQTDKLKQSKEFLTLIMNSIPDLVFVKDKKFRVVRANQAFLNIYPPEKRNQVIGHTTIENFSQEEANLFLEQDRIAFENGVAQTHEEILLYTGDKLNIFSTKVRFSDENNEEYILCISRDISELIDIQKGLERKVEERTLEYKKQKILAEKAGNAKEEFLANMSHELRTPLNSIIGLTKILIDEGVFEEDERETLDIIDRASISLLRTVNDILDISKIESGKIQLDNNGFNLSALLHSLVDQFKPLASQKGIEIHHNLSTLEDTYVTADEYRISRIITNLVGNAIKYTDNGFIEINFKVENDNEEVTDFTIQVTDTGIGISQENQEHIFDKFTQAEKSTERLYGGTGLGLSITRQLVELMMGSISVDSEVGKGSKFTVKIPLTKSEASEVTNDEEDSSNKRSNARKIPIPDAKILVAEDHEFNQVFVKKILKRLGNNNFKIVSNGIEALSEFKNNHYDLVLMDYHMPTMNGYEATDKIRSYENEINKPFSTPIIAMTADIMPGTEEKCLKIGMNDYVSKPINEEILRYKIHKWLNISNNNITELEESTPSKKDTRMNLSLLNEYTDGNKRAQKELIDLFYSKSLKDIATLKKNSTNGYNKKWIEAAHSLKGSSSYIGASVLKNLCAIAQAMEDTEKEEKTDMYEKIKTEHQKLCKALKKSGLL